MIKLSNIIKIPNVEEYKIHVAKWSGYTQPLDAYLRSFDEWVEWNAWRGDRNRYGSSKYVFSVMHFYPQPNTFLFGGIFEILKVHSDHYDIKLLDDFSEYIGRLKLTGIITPRGSAFEFKNYYNNIIVTEILPKKYETLSFPGFENIDLQYETLNQIIRNESLEWKIPLESIYGVYMLTDIKSGKRYIGSAYGGSGIWSRWATYCNDGHGGNVELKKMIDENGMEYFKANFKFTLLEVIPKYALDSDVILRESYWKEVMMSRREEFGYNSN